MKRTLLTFLLIYLHASYGAVLKKESQIDTTLNYQEGIYEYDLNLNQQAVFNFGIIHPNSGLSRVILVLHNNSNDTAYIRKFYQETEGFKWKYQTFEKIAPRDTVELRIAFEQNQFIPFENQFEISYRQNRSKSIFSLRTEGQLMQGEARVTSTIPPTIPPDFTFALEPIFCYFPEDTSDNIIDFPEREAEFPGGMDSLMAYINKNLRYPQFSIDRAVQGVVYLRFVVNKDGSIGEIEVLRGVIKEMDDEAIRLVKEMPKWKPAFNKGEPVRSRYIIPVRFILQG